MPPKGQKAPAGKGKGGEDKQEEAFRAIVLADSFETKFTPFTLERPRCLLPLANTPLLEYTFEFLASAGVGEVYMYAGAHTEQVETYVQASKWSQKSSPFRLSFLRDETATCVGDVMRNLDSKHIFDKSADFLVVSGDIVADYPIHQALAAHRTRRERNKDAIMTMLLREAPEEVRLHSKTPLPTFVIDPVNDRCLHYEETPPHKQYSAHIEAEALKQPELDIRQDLLDCRIDICAPDVLTLYSDNFDHQSPRKDFLFGVLKDHELNGKTIHTYITRSHYVARIADLPCYDTISRDLVSGKVPSLAIENNIFRNGSYSRSYAGPILGQGVIRSRPSQIDSATVIGPGTSIARDTRLARSLVGSRCNIGKRCRIRQSYIWDDVTIGSDVSIENAIIGSETFIGDNCTIEEGALISFGVHLVAGTNVPAGVKVTKTSNGASGTEIGGGGYEYQDDEDDEDDLDAAPGLVYMHRRAADSVSTLGSDISEPESPIDNSRSQSFATTQSDEDSTDRFQHDTVAILLQRMQEGHKVDDMQSELMGLRFSGSADEVSVRKAVAAAISRRIHSQVEEGRSATEAAHETINTYQYLIRRERVEQSTAEQVEFLLEVQRTLSRRNQGGKVFGAIAIELYNLDIAEEDAIMLWWNDKQSQKNEEMAGVRELTKPLIDRLEESDSESEEDEDEEE
ncbi:putative translation initiation factor eIF-2B subunit epsilon [Cyphellophora attinorum]|uniref:Mannose-1-phosphate guanyltransferase n=1 Tax=Cyphellophora attinorum TaxID=1664694 RepID=A0A0N0NI17_9EURO|nr:putative translation initiation factor eIF-2B subunit epsilon [Phialophora attinorum]KPI34929.1 putative translation initiation factor eIF-2B subunit epsilon [Phialophora attinorum]